MTKRITITSGDYVLLSDIPNKQVFNLVKECFGNAGFNSVSVWEERIGWSAFYATDNFCNAPKMYSCFVESNNAGCFRQLSLSDVFNSTNGGFRWFGESYAHIYKHEILFSGSKHASCPPPLITVQRVFTVSGVDESTKPNTYKISRLWNLNCLERTDVNLIEGRALGKSTAHHLELISKAMKSPEQWVKVYSDYDNSERHNRWAFEEVRDLCHKLGLDWMEFSVSGNSIRYMPYQTVKMVTKWELVE